MARETKLDVDDSDDDRDARPAVAEEAENYEQTLGIDRDSERALGKSLVGSGAEETPTTDTE